jgi:integrase
MKRKNPPFVHGYVDQHGTAKFYFRRAGQPKVRLPGLPWSMQFMAAYEQAKSGQWSKPEVGSNRTVPGTVNAALVSYYQSSAFHDGLADSSRKMRRAILESFREEHGDKQIATMHTQALQNIVNKKTPAAQRNFMKAMRGFINHCRSHGQIQSDPLKGVELTKMKTVGHHTWTDDEIARYRAHHPAGSKPRLALALLLQTGHARADVVRMGRQHVRNGTLSMRRQKTNVQFDIPLLPELLAELELHPRTEQLAFLTTEQGKPFSAAGFGNKFRRWCNEAGLPHCSAHGLRKAAAVRHALNGATAPELMAWFGWKTIGETQRYIEAANRVRLAESAGVKMRTGIGSPQYPVSQNGD